MFRRPSMYTRVSLNTVPKTVCVSGRKKKANTAESLYLGELGLGKPSPAVECICIGKGLFVPVLYELLVMRV